MENGPRVKNGGVAQLGEHLLCKQGVIGSIPFISTKGRKVRTTGGLTRYGLIAQPVRAHAYKREVGGSSPLKPTKRSNPQNVP